MLCSKLRILDLMCLSMDRSKPKESQRGNYAVFRNNIREWYFENLQIVLRRQTGHI